RRNENPRHEGRRQSCQQRYPGRGVADLHEQGRRRTGRMCSSAPFYHGRHSGMRSNASGKIIVQTLRTERAAFMQDKHGRGVRRHKILILNSGTDFSTNHSPIYLYTYTYTYTPIHLYTNIPLYLSSNAQPYPPASSSTPDRRQLHGTGAVGFATASEEGDLRKNYL